MPNHYVFHSRFVNLFSVTSTPSRRSVLGAIRQVIAVMNGLSLPVLAVFTLVGSALASNPAEVSASWHGPAQQVFDSDADGCDMLDIPDHSARAFRDASGRVHLFATHYNARAMVGPSLDAVRHDCQVVYRSRQDPDPSRFDDRNWLAAFYTEDGRRVVALVHSEYEAWNHPGMCAKPKAQWPELANCWWNTITMAVSENGGTSFTAPTAPTHLVASLPYRYEKANTLGAFGYKSPTNIIRSGQYYYAMILTWPYKAQRYGPCLIRTKDLFDAASWRAWDGQDFSIRFVNPYLDQLGEPEDHVCTPVGAPGLYMPGSLSVYGEKGPHLAVQITRDSRFGIPGLYISASSNLIHWSKPSLVAGTDAMLREEPNGLWEYDYVSLIDPKAPDLNFVHVTDAPFVYYVRFNKTRSNSSRTLMRRQVRLHLG